MQLFIKMLNKGMSLDWGSMHWNFSFQWEIKIKVRVNLDENDAEAMNSSLTVMKEAAEKRKKKLGSLILKGKLSKVDEWNQKGKN